MTLPSLVLSLLGLQGSLARLFATDDGLCNLLHQAREMPRCQFSNVFTVVTGAILQLTVDTHLFSNKQLFGHKTRVTGGSGCFSSFQPQIRHWAFTKGRHTNQLWRLSLLHKGHEVLRLVGHNTGYYENLSSTHGVSSHCLFFQSDLFQVALSPTVCRSSRNSSIKASYLDFQTLPILK